MPETSQAPPATCSLLLGTGSEQGWRACSRCLANMEREADITGSRPSPKSPAMPTGPRVTGLHASSVLSTTPSPCPIPSPALPSWPSDRLSCLSLCTGCSLCPDAAAQVPTGLKPPGPVQHSAPPEAFPDPPVLHGPSVHMPRGLMFLPVLTLCLLHIPDQPGLRMGRAWANTVRPSSLLNKNLWTRKAGQVGGECWEVPVGPQPGRKAGAWTPRVETRPRGMR